MVESQGKHALAGLHARKSLLKSPGFPREKLLLFCR